MTAFGRDPWPSSPTRAALWTILPVKPFDRAKSRLAGLLSPQARADLAAALFSHTLATALRFAGGRPVLVVSESAEALTLASQAGAVALCEQAGGLNAALRGAAAHARAHGASHILTLSCDLPLIGLQDLQALEAADPEGSAIAPDRRRRGTNALLQPAHAAPVFAYGPNSYVRHTASLRRRGFPPAEVRRIGLGFDLDEERDLLDLSRRLAAGEVELNRDIGQLLSRWSDVRDTASQPLARFDSMIGELASERIDG